MRSLRELQTSAPPPLHAAALHSGSFASPLSPPPTFDVAVPSVPEFAHTLGYDYLVDVVPRVATLTKQATSLLSSLYNYRGAHRGIPNVRQGEGCQKGCG